MAEVILLQYHEHASQREWRGQCEYVLLQLGNQSFDIYDDVLGIDLLSIYQKVDNFSRECQAGIWSCWGAAAVFSSIDPSSRNNSSA